MISYSKYKKSGLWLPDYKPRFPCELIPGHPMSFGMVGGWIMNEGSGNKTSDSSRNGNNFVLTSGATWVANFLRLSGVVQAEANNCNSLGLQGCIDISFSADDVIAGASQGLFEISDDTANNRLLVYLLSTNYLSIYQYGSGSGNNIWQYQNPTFLLDGVISHLTINYDCSTDSIDLYHNGNLIIPTSTGNAGTPAGFDTINLGTFYDLSFDFTGNFYAFKLYNKQLTPSEISWLHAEPFCMIREKSSRSKPTNIPWPTTGQWVTNLG